MNITPRILMIYIEPTPYSLDLISVLQKSWDGSIEVFFLQENFSQQWQLKHQHVFLDKKDKVFKLIWQCFVSKKYDLIFLAGWSHALILIFLLLAKIFHISVVVDSDTPILPCISKWKQILKRMIYPMLFRLPTHFLPAGTRQANYLKQYGVPVHKITLEKMTVDVAGMQHYIQELPTDARISFRAKLGLSPNDVIFLFIGRLIERKGVNELLEAFSQIIHPQARLLIAGDGPLKSSVTEATDKRIIYAGWLEKNKLIELYVLSDVFVLPAHWEPWGLVINEAFAAGKPVITTDQVGCVDDLVIPNKTGLIVPAQDIRALTQAMSYFLENPGMLEDYQKNTLEIIKNWTLQDETEQIIGVFRQNSVR